MVKLCVFDMDGTVVNSIGDIAAALNRSLEKMGYPTHSEDAYYKMVGDGMAVLCRRAIEGAPEEDVQKLIAIYDEDYKNNCCERSYIYDGMADAVKKLKAKGIKCAILSNKPHGQLMEIAKVLFEDDMFDEIMGHTSDFAPKPDPGSMLYLMDKMGYNSEEVVFVGDSNVDIRLGKAADVYTVGVTWGFRGEEELKTEGADVIVNTADELYNAILKK